MRVLVIEDEKEIRDFLCDELRFNGMEVMGLDSGNMVERILETFDPDVVLTDQLMPGKSGTDLVKEIRSNSKYAHLPIMMITALGAESDKVKAFDLGCDDYVTKPFRGKEVVARVKALARRASMNGSAQPQAAARLLRYKTLEVDFGVHRVLNEGEEIPLTLTEFKILCELLKQSGHVLTRDALRERALGNLFVTDRTIDVHMASLRKKLGVYGDEIETVRGVGYRMANADSQN